MKTSIFKKFGLAIAALFILTGTLFAQAQSANVDAVTAKDVDAVTAKDVDAAKVNSVLIREEEPAEPAQEAVPAEAEKPAENAVPASDEKAVPAEAAQESVPAETEEPTPAEEAKPAKKYSWLDGVSARPDIIGESCVGAFYGAFILWLLIGLVIVFIFSRKQLKVEKTYVLPSIESDAVDETVDLPDFDKEFKTKKFVDKETGETAYYLPKATMMYRLHDRLEGILQQSGKLTSLQAETVNYWVAVHNQTLMRQNGALIYGKLLRFVFGLFWVALFGFPLLPAFFSFNDGAIGAGFLAILFALPVEALVAIFFIARKNANTVLTPDYDKLQDDWLVWIYNKVWLLLGATAGVGAGAALTSPSSETVYVDRDTGSVVGRESNMLPQLFIGLVIFFIAVFLGFFVFTIVQAALIMYLFLRFYYLRLPKKDEAEGATFPMKRNPWLIWGPVIAAAVLWLFFAIGNMVDSGSYQAKRMEEQEKVVEEQQKRNEEAEKVQEAKSAEQPKAEEAVPANAENSVPAEKVEEAVPAENAEAKPAADVKKLTNELFDLCRNPQRLKLTDFNSLIERGADVNANVNGFTPLVIAVVHQNTTAVGALLNKGADPNFVMRNKQKICDFAAVRGNETIQKFFKNAEETEESEETTEPAGTQNPAGTQE